MTPAARRRPRCRGAAAALRIVALVAPLLMGGCAWLSGPRAENVRTADAPEPPETPVVLVEVVAPGELKALLERHLDLSRLARLTRGDAVTGSELARLLDTTPAQVRELLQTEGHFNPDVRLRRAAPALAGGIETVTVEVDPGPQATISRVTLEVEGPLERAAAAGDGLARDTLAAWRASWAMRTGSRFRNADWSEAKAGALARLRSNGYANAAWSGTSADVDAARNEVRLFVVLDSGALFRSGPIDVDGLVRQDRRTVEALAGFPRGTPVTEALLLDYQERLQRAGLFESVTVTLDTDPDRADAAPILVRLREQPIQVFTFGVGISANTGPRASVEHAYRRVFGAAVSSSNKVEWGRLRQAWTGEVSTHPGAGFTRWLLGGAIERLPTNADTVLSQRLRFGRAQDSRTLERLVFAEAERGVRSTDLSRVDTFALSANLHLVLRRLDSVVLPTDGYTLALQGGVGRSHGSASASGFFTRAYGRLTGYLPLGSAWYGQARIELGKVFLPGNVAAPDSQLWRAGGDDSVRGYGYRTLGPIRNGVVGSGPVLVTGSVELARPLMAELPSLWGAVFVDAGRAGDDLRGLRPAVGIGAGVRWRSPVGPLRLDIAWGEETQKLRLHLSVGIAF